MLIQSSMIRQPSQYTTQTHHNLLIPSQTHKINTHTRVLHTHTVHIHHTYILPFIILNRQTPTLSGCHPSETAEQQQPRRTAGHHTNTHNHQIHPYIYTLSSQPPPTSEEPLAATADDSPAGRRPWPASTLHHHLHHRRHHQITAKTEKKSNLKKSPNWHKSAIERDESG
ncbi:hypothetical protein Dimus_039329 [Dionaea muscipula]